MRIGYHRNIGGKNSDIKQMFAIVNSNNSATYTVYTRSSKCFHSFWKIQKVFLRYGQKHIGLGTKRFVDSLGSC